MFLCMVVFSTRVCVAPHIRRKNMSWKTPKIVEIALGAEINSYACAETTK